MRYDVVVFGNLHFSRGRYKAWQRVVVDSRADRRIARIFPKKPHWPAASVGELLGTLPAATGHDMFHLEHDEDGLYAVRALVTDKLFETRCRQIAAFFMSAAQVEAEGHICLLGEGVHVGYGVSLGGGEADIIKLTEEQITNAALDPAVDKVSDHFRAAAPASSAAVLAESHRPTNQRPGLAQASGPKKDLLRLPRGFLA